MSQAKEVRGRSSTAPHYGAIVPPKSMTELHVIKSFESTRTTVKAGKSLGTRGEGGKEGGRRYEPLMRRCLPPNQKVSVVINDSGVFDESR